MWWPREGLWETWYYSTVLFIEWIEEFCMFDQILFVKIKDFPDINRSFVDQTTLLPVCIQFTQCVFLLLTALFVDEVPVWASVEVLPCAVQCNKALEDQCWCIWASSCTAFASSAQTVQHDRGVTAEQPLLSGQSLGGSGFLLLSAACVAVLGEAGVGKGGGWWVFWISSSSSLQPHSVLTSCLTDSATVSCSESGTEAVCQEDEQEGGLQLSFLASDGVVRAKSIFLTSIQSVEWLVSVLVTWKVIVGMSVQLWPLITEAVSKFNSNLSDPWHRRCRQEFNILQK